MAEHLDAVLIGLNWIGDFLSPHDIDPPEVRDLEVHFGERGDVIARWNAVDRWNATPPEELSFRVLVDGKPPEGAAFPDGQQISLSKLASGRHVLRVTAMDSLGNISPPSTTSTYRRPCGAAGPCCWPRAPPSSRCCGCWW